VWKSPHCGLFHTLMGEFARCEGNLTRGRAGVWTALDLGKAAHRQGVRPQGPPWQRLLALGGQESRGLRLV
jgi:hypothetical protein